jgi:uroporphyrinogen decarboxylase
MGPAAARQAGPSDTQAQGGVRVAMTSQERISLALQHKEADRIAIYDSPWATTVRRWRTEGLPDGVSPADHFGYETASIPYDRSLRLEPELIEETDDYTIRRDASGTVTRNWKHQTSTPELIDFLLKDRATWEEHKERFLPAEDRVDWEQVRQQVAAARANGKFVCFGGSFGFQLIFSRMVGPERTMLAMADDPMWAKEMFDAVATMTIGMGEILLDAGIDFDAGHFADDLGYRNGTFFSMYRELIFPAHKRICDFFRARGIPVILHCCGNANAIVPDLIEAGIAALNPLEVKAGMDLLELKRRYGDVLTLIGGIDVRTWARGDLAEIEHEIRTKVSVAKRGGGYIFHSDHSIPDDVSFATYSKVVDLAMHYGRYQ